MGFGAGENGMPGKNGGWTPLDCYCREVKVIHDWRLLIACSVWAALLSFLSAAGPHHAFRVICMLLHLRRAFHIRFPLRPSLNFLFLLCTSNFEPSFPSPVTLNSILLSPVFSPFVCIKLGSLKGTRLVSLVTAPLISNGRWPCLPVLPLVLR